MQYKQSKYNYIKVGEKVVIYNTFSDGLAVFEKSEYEKLQRIQDCCNLDEDMRGLLQQGFIIDAEKDELAIVNYCRYRDTFVKKRPIYRILTTSNCNARCFYCYEKGKPNYMMTEETASNVAEYIINNTNDVERLTLNWFGGEPLLNPSVITLITRRVRNALCNKRINSTIITNASLFTKEMICLAKDEWKLSNIQITLDGLSDYHEKRKAYINKRYTFDKTIETIGNLLDAGLYVTLRLNYDKENYEDIIRLIYFISNTYGNPSNLSCYSYPLFNNSHYKNQNYLSSDDIPKYESRIKDVLVETGYYNPLKMSLRRTNACFATDPYSCVIDPQGFIYKCSMDMYDPSRSLGDVKNGVTMGNQLIEWTTPVLPDVCNKCILLPICQGGCRASRLLNIDMNDCAIKRQIIEYSLSYILKHF